QSGAAHGHGQRSTTTSFQVHLARGEAQALSHVIPGPARRRPPLRGQGRPAAKALEWGYHDLVWGMDPRWEQWRQPVWQAPED
ncbi:MAG: hypothetical protein O7G32_07980, partial [SAR324 cluster bacterium]|nr:hypothetical protein [SAR324 cluster bacterium]